MPKVGGKIYSYDKAGIAAGSKKDAKRRVKGAPMARTLNKQLKQ